MQPEQAVRLVDVRVLLDFFLALQKLFQEDLLKIDHLLFAPELREDVGVRDGFRARDKRRAGEADLVALDGQLSGFVGKDAGLGQTVGVHLQTKGVLHGLDGFLEAVGDRPHGGFAAAAGSVKRIEAITGGGAVGTD